MSSWDCRIEVIRETVVDADDEAQAKALALDWFFNNCIHAVGDADVCVDLIDDERTDV